LPWASPFIRKSKDVAETIVRAAEKEYNIGEKYLVDKYQLSFREINQVPSEIYGVPLHTYGSGISIPEPTGR
jgi:hypothetical protein